MQRSAASGVDAIVSDPLGRPVSARWLLLPDGRAVVEAAAAIGLPLLADDERDPLVASSRGLGELVLAALHEQPRCASRRSRWKRDRGRRSRPAGGPARALDFDDRALRCDDDACATRLASSARRRARRRTTSRSSSAGSPEWTSSCPTPGFRAPAPPEVSAQRLLLSEPSSCRARRRFSTSSASTTACATASSRSRARVRSTRRRPKERRRESSPRAARRRAFAVSSSAAVSCRRSTACETVGLSGDPRARRGRPRSARRGGSARASETRRRRAGRPSTRASSRRPAGAPRRTAGTRRPAVRRP